jgi:heme/copper-type cytochrome/quinol oxidase subunit 3
MVKMLLIMHHIALGTHALHYVIVAIFCICVRSRGAIGGNPSEASPTGVRRSTSVKWQ